MQVAWRGDEWRADLLARVVEQVRRPTIQSSTLGASGRGLGAHLVADPHPQVPLPAQRHSGWATPMLCMRAQNERARAFVFSRSGSRANEGAPVHHACGRGNKCVRGARVATAVCVQVTTPRLGTLAWTRMLNVCGTRVRWRDGACDVCARAHCQGSPCATTSAHYGIGRGVAAAGIIWSNHTALLGVPLISLV